MGDHSRAVGHSASCQICSCAVVRSDQVVGTVPDARSRLLAHEPADRIGGPSATSDVEWRRVEGVHGPRTLDIVLVAG